MKRKVEIYHWTESKSTVTVNDMSGGRIKRDEYTYKTVWGESVTSSSGFHIPMGHENPVNLPFFSEKFVNKEVNIQQFVVVPAIVDQLNNFKMLPLEKVDGLLLQNMDMNIRNNCKIVDNFTIYYGRDPSDPYVGDMKIQYCTIDSPLQVSVIAQKIGLNLVPVNYEGVDMSIIKEGILNARSLIQIEEGNLNMKLWLGRLGGWFVNYLSLYLIAGPIFVISEIFPLFWIILTIKTFWQILYTSLRLSFISIFLAQDLSTAIKIGLFILFISSGSLVLL